MLDSPLNNRSAKGMARSDADRNDKERNFLLGASDGRLSVRSSMRAPPTTVSAVRGSPEGRTCICTRSRISLALCSNDEGKSWVAISRSEIIKYVQWGHLYHSICHFKLCIYLTLYVSSACWPPRNSRSEGASSTHWSAGSNRAASGPETIEQGAMGRQDKTKPS